MENLQVAKTIALQLGGTGKLQAMLGAYAFVGDTNSLIFKFKCRAKDSINCLNITLNGKDLYDIQYIRVRAMKATVVEVQNDVYCDQMKHMIEQRIGLYLSL